VETSDRTVTGREFSPLEIKHILNSAINNAPGKKNQRIILIPPKNRHLIDTKNSIGNDISISMISPTSMVKAGRAPILKRQTPLATGMQYCTACEPTSLIKPCSPTSSWWDLWRRARGRISTANHVDGIQVYDLE